MTGCRARVIVVALTGVAAALSTSQPNAQAGLTEANSSRTVYVSASRDPRATPVTDLVLQEFLLREDGQPRAILRVEPAVAPMQIAVLVDDNGSGIFRSGLARFIQRLQGQAEFSSAASPVQVMRIVDYTANMTTLANGLVKLGVRPGTPDGGQLLEGILQSAIDLRKREAQRGVIVVLTVGGEEHSTVRADFVLDEIVRSGAILHVVSVARSALRSTVPITTAASLLEENLNLQEVLGEGPKQSGGRIVESVASAGMFDGLQQIADELLHQYAVVYDRPGHVRSLPKLNISVTRPGVQVRGPSRTR